MSLAFIAFCLWTLAAALSGYAPADRRDRLRWALLALALPIILGALLSQGWLPAIFASIGVVAMFPGLIAGLWTTGLGLLRGRVAGLREGAAQA